MVGKTPENKKSAETAAPVRREDVSVYIGKPNRYGFLKFTGLTLTTLSAEHYDAILSDEEKWNALKALMEADFHDELVMFPYQKSTGSPSSKNVNWIEAASIRIGNLFKNLSVSLKLSAVDLPRRYFRITNERIVRRFPGGQERGDDIGDGDVRDMLSDLKIVFKENLARLIAHKRWRQLRFFLIYLVLSFLLVALADALPSWNVWQDGSEGFFTSLLGRGITETEARYVSAAGVSGLLVLIFFSVRHFYKAGSDVIFASYNNAQNESCMAVDKQAALRTRSLSHLVSTLFARMNTDQAKLLGREQAQDWPERSSRWVMLIYWLARRQEGLETYAQIQIWLIRRAHYFYSIVGNALHGVVFAASLVTLGLATWGMLAFFVSPAQFSSLIALGVALILNIVLLLRITRLSSKEWNTPIKVVEEHLDVSNWDRFHSIQLHEQLAAQVFADKSYILQREDWVAGKNR